jgi:hypothetical protein
MQPTFVTGGDVRPEYNSDGSVKCYHVSRKEGDPMWLHYCIDEYYSEGHRIYIDNYGSPWVRK